MAGTLGPPTDSAGLPRRTCGRVPPARRHTAGTHGRPYLQQVHEDPPGRSRNLRIARVAGVPVLLTPSWFLLAALVVVVYGPALAGRGTAAEGYAAAAGFAVLLLLSVLLHEIGHCLVARALGLRVRSITLTFLAGLTEVVDAPPTPARAGAVSVAGPLVSALLAVVCAGVAFVLPPGTAGRLAALAALTNTGLAIFNLLPGLPLDGGGVLRAVVWRVTGDRSRATVVAAQTGRVLGIVVVPLFVLGGVRLVGGDLSVVGAVSGALVALFVYSGATGALAQARVEQRLSAVSAGALGRPALLVAPRVPLSEALRRAAEAGLLAMVVVDDSGTPRAVVSEAAVRAVPEQRRPWVDVGDLARPLADELGLDPGLSGEDLLDAVRRTPASEYVVTAATGPRVLVTADLERAAAGRPVSAVA